MPDSVVDISYALTAQWYAERCAKLLADEHDRELTIMQDRIRMLHAKARRLGIYASAQVGPYFMQTGPNPTWESVFELWGRMTVKEKTKFLIGENT